MKKIIFISNYHVEGSELEVINQTLLHEIAHAHQFKDGRRNEYGARIKPHGVEFYKSCTHVGALHQRCSENAYSLAQPNSKYNLWCTHCGKTYTMNRYPGRRSCSTCHPGGFNEKYLLDFKKNY
jgi:predicted SprT family Zn-dependent metalloprotease